MNTDQRPSLPFPCPARPYTRRSIPHAHCPPPLSIPPVIMVQRLFFIFAFLHSSIIPVHFHACILRTKYIYYLQSNKIYNTKKKADVVHLECTTSAVIPLAPCTGPGSSEYIIKFINTPGAFCARWCVHCGSSAPPGPPALPQEWRRWR